MSVGPLLPCPRFLRQEQGSYTLPARALFQMAEDFPKETTLLPLAERLRVAAAIAGCELAVAIGPAPKAAIRAHRAADAPAHEQGYALVINREGIRLTYGQPGGLRAGIATLRQLLRAHGRRLPCLSITDYPDFPRRGVMLDISRGRVPKLQTLFDLAEHLADFKINELQLYTEHTFAYSNYTAVWSEWGALTPSEIRRLDKRCQELGIELVPNQNSFGHLRYWLAQPSLKHLAETKAPYEDGGGLFLRHPTTLAPNHPGTLPFLRSLYDELLPCFTSRRFNVGCDETWDLGRGRSKRLCDRRGKGRVYLDFLLKIHREVKKRGLQMMFWGDIILHYPELVSELPKDCIPLNWGYEAGHPFSRESEMFAKARLPFYVCPGTSTWMTLIGRHDNALTNLREAAEAGRSNGAVGYLITDWGDGGHPQPLAVSYLPYLAGAALSWCTQTFCTDSLVPVLSRDVFDDATQRLARAALALGHSHRTFDFLLPNRSPFGAVLASPPLHQRELACYGALGYFAKIPKENVLAAQREVEKQLTVLQRSRATNAVLATELDLAARIAAQSCKFMLWQQATSRGDLSTACQLATQGIRDLEALDEEFRGYWPLRNKSPFKKCAGFLRWRIQDYQRGAVS
jgi:hexosaminidase